MNKRCPKCDTVKPLKDFQKNRRQKDGLQVWCRLCHNKTQNKKRQDAPDSYRDYQREWRERHPGYFGHRRKRLRQTGTHISLD